MIKVSGFQVAPAEIEARPARPPWRGRLRGVRRGRRAGRRGAGRRRPARARLRRHGRGTAATWSAEALATYKRLHHVVIVDAIPRTPSGKVLRRTLRDEWAPILAAATAATLMDVRLSPEQAALRDSAAQVVDRLGVRTVGAARRRASGRQARRGGRRLRLAGAADARRRTARPLGLGGRGRHRRRGARPGSGRRRLPRPDPGGRAAPPGRRPGHDRAARRSRSTADLSAPAVCGGRARRRRSRGDRRRRPPRQRWCSWPGRSGYAVGAVAVAGVATGGRPDPARRRRPRADGRRRSTGQSRPLDADDARRAGGSLGLAVTCADLVGTMRGALDAGRRLRRGRAGSTARPSAPSRPCSTCWPTPSSPWRARAASPCTRPGRSTRCRAADALAAAVGGQGLLRPGRPRRVRDGHPGARRHRQHLGVPGPRLPAAGPALDRRARRGRAPTSTGCSRPAAIGGRRWTSVTRPTRRAFRLRLRDVARRQQPGPAAVVDGRRVLGRAGRLAPDALRRRVLRPVLADGDRRPRASRASTTSSSTRSSPRPARRRGRASATWCRASCEHGNDGRAAPLPARAGQRARPLVPGIQRARCRLGPGVAAHPRRPRRRRVRDHRPQGVDQLLGRGRLVPGPGPDRSRRAQAPGHLRLRRADAPDRHRAAAAAR